MTAEARGQLSPAVSAALERLDELVKAFAEHPEAAVQDAVFELLRSVDAVHRHGLGGVARLLKAEGLLGRAFDDPDVRLLFELYDLGEGGERARADRVLDAVRPYIESHGGRLEVVEADAGVVKVRLSGACHGCPGSSATLRHVVDQALRAALTEFVRLEVLDDEPPPYGLIPVSRLAAPKRPSLAWHAVLRADEVPEAGLRGVEVEGAGVLIVNLAGELYAYANLCPGTALPLDGGAVESEMILCPWHGCRFDARGGRRLDGSGGGLGVMPIAVADGEVRIGVLPGAA